MNLGRRGRGEERREKIGRVSERANERANGRTGLNKSKSKSSVPR